MSQRVLSLIVPAYNMREYLDSCLASLRLEREEVASAVQVIVIDDGSVDETGEIAERWHARHPNQVDVVHKENGHYGSCVNVGLSLARGQYVKLLDADDTVDGEEFLRFLKYLRSCEKDLVLSDFTLVDEEGRVLRHRAYDDSVAEGGLLAWLDEKNPLQNPAIAYRTELLTALSYRQVERVSYSDVEWCIYPLARVRTVGCSHCRLYRYLIGRPGQSVSQYYRLRSDLERVLKSLLENYRSYVGKAISTDNKVFITSRVAEHARFVLEVIVSNARLIDLRQEYNRVFDGLAESNEINEAVKELRAFRRFGGVRLFALMRTHFVSVFPLMLLYRWRLKIGGGR